MKKIQWGILFFVLIAAGCRTSRITTSWRSSQIETKKYSRILVLGLINDADRRIQERMEQHLAGDLTDLGYTAISALQEYGPKAFDGLDEKAAIDKLKKSGADAVLTIVLLDKRKESKYVPGQINYQGELLSYYGYRYSRIYEPGYYVTNTKYFWESNFYDMATRTLLYSVQTRSFSPENTESLGHEYGKLIVANMVNQKILQSLKKETE